MITPILFLLDKISSPFMKYIREMKGYTDFDKSLTSIVKGIISHLFHQIYTKINDKVTIKMDPSDEYNLMGSLNEYNLMSEVLEIYEIVLDFHKYSPRQGKNIFKWRHENIYVPNLKYLTFTEYKGEIFDKLLYFVQTIAVHHENGHSLYTLTRKELDEINDLRDYLFIQLSNLTCYTNIVNRINVCNDRYLLFALFTRKALDELQSH